MKAQVLLVPIFWSFVPSALTAFIQRTLYSAKVLKPLNPQSQKRHGTIIFTLVILTYLSFSVVKSYYDLEPNFYSVLDVPIDFKTKDLKLNYRSLSLKYHPDKNSHLTQELKDEYHEKYLKIRKAYEVLSNKVTLFAYEKFSDGMLECNTCRTKKDYVYDGLLNVLTYHGFSTFAVLMMGMFSESRYSFWKFLWLFGEIALEFFMLSDVGNLQILNHLTTGEKIVLLRSLGVSGYMTVNALTSVWSVKVRKISELVSELGHLNQSSTNEIAQWYKWIYEPFSADISQKELQGKMTDYGFISRLSRSSIVTEIKKND